MTTGKGGGSQAMGMTARLDTGPWAMLLVLLVAVAAYVDTLAYGFVWDDKPMVIQSLLLRHPGSPGRLLRSDFTDLTGGEIPGHYYRPVLAVSLALDLLLWGRHAAGLHLTNLLLHALATFLVARLALALGGRRDLAVAAGLIFALHPAHVEAVAFVSARGDLLAAVGAAMCLLAYRRSALAGSGRLAWTLAALLSGGLALLAKESASTLPLLLMLADLLVPPDPSVGRGPALRAGLLRSLPFWALTLAVTLVRLQTLLALSRAGLSPETLWRRLPGAFEILARYVRLSLFPIGMRPLYDLPRPATLFAPWPLLGISLALAAGLLIWRSGRPAPLVAFGTAWFLAAALPVLDLVPLSYRAMGLTDRYLYLPSVGVSIAVAAAVVALLESRPGPWRVSRVAASWIALVLVLTLYPWSLLRYAAIWRDDVTLYLAMERLAPRAASAAANVGITYLQARDLPRATAALERALRLDPTDRKGRAILAHAYLLQGRTTEADRLLDALARDSVRTREYYVAQAARDLGRGAPAAALAISQQGLRQFPGQAAIIDLMGRALEQLGRQAEARQAYEAALRLDPDAFRTEEQLGGLLAATGQPGEAAQHFLRALEIRPDHFEAVRALALLADASGYPTQSLGHWRRALELAPDGDALHEAIDQIRRLDHAALRDAGVAEAPRPGGR